jgi:predicted PurR-regulated permease PerM
VSARTIAKVILVAAAIGASLYVLYLVRSVIWLVLVAIFVAVALGPPVDLLQHRLHIRRGLAILVTYLALLAGVFVVGLAVVPPIVDQTDQFINAVPGYVDDLTKNDTFARYDEQYHITEELRQQAAQLPSRVGDAAGALRDVTVGVFSALIQLVSVLVLAFFLLLDGKRIVDWGLGELGSAKERRFRGIADDIYRSVGGYVAGNLVISLIAGFTAWVVLTLLDVRFAVPLALMMALLDLIPLVGATIGGLIVTTVCAIENFPEAPIIFFVYLVVYQQIENNILQPIIYRRTVKLHPLIVLVGILVGAELLGVLGVLLAIPVAGAIQIFVKDYWEYRRQRPEPGAAIATP